ncbi:LptA/OstA family protein, partial [Salmonella enterica]|uniref:LptA/OstA family protein n=1 Tax=Salmonella enterica TaxID=28901 RepID=UPI003D2B3466
MVFALAIGAAPVAAQQPSKAAPKAVPAQSDAAAGGNASPGGIFGGGRAASTDQPIDISSNALEVQQARQVAIFTGQVEAIQGDLRLKADTLKVHYRQKSASPAPGA